MAEQLLLYPGNKTTPFGGAMRHFLLSLVLSLSLVACTQGTDTTTHAAKETAPKMSDSDLKAMVQQKINADADLQAAKLDVDADADHNAITLSGKVATEAQRSRAVELARAANPGLTVTDKIDVTPREVPRAEYTSEQARAEVDRAKANKESVGDSLDDAWIHAKIVTKLMADSQTPEHKINVDVNSNVVTLRGTVGTPAAKQEAERLARETEGVKRVNNQLKVAAGESR
jgi:hyperosmotically inducible periplasmic protein